MTAVQDLFSLDGRVAVVTGGTGVVGGALVGGLAAAGARVVVLSRSLERARNAVSALGPDGLGVEADVLEQSSLVAARDRVVERFGRVDILINAAGGNVPGATLQEDAPLHLSADAFRAVLDLNLMGTVLPIAAFLPAMLSSDPARGGASILNIASAAAIRPLTRVPGYSAAKAAVTNFTRWLAVDLGRRHSGRVRVNALVPGFFVAEQNRSLLLEADGTPTARGRRVLDRTPLGRFGVPDELVGAALWLCGPAAGFVTGAMIVVDGGFDAAPGV